LPLITSLRSPSTVGGQRTGRVSPRQLPRLTAPYVALVCAGQDGQGNSGEGGVMPKSGSYDDWTKPDLLKRAREIGIKGRSTMTKAELIKALRNH
jgi:hypothetical protein